MNYHSISFPPKLTNNLFSDRLNQIDKIFSTLIGENKVSEIPNYDFIKTSNNQYQLILVVPGFQEKELDISVENQQLIIVGKKEENKNNNKITNTKFLYQGIKNNNFSIYFDLYNPIKIHKAKLNLGLLTINFEYEIPENQKIKKIYIETK